MTTATCFPELEEPAGGGLVVRTVETHWGYIIRAEENTGDAIRLVQGLAGLLGVASIAASVGFWALPGAFFSADVALLKLGATFLTASFGIFLLWYASEGSTYELQVDIAHEELREAMRNAKGQARMRRRHRFEDIGKIFVLSDEDNDTMASLMLRIGQSDQVILAARAPEHQLFPLRNRLAKDLAGPAQSMRRDKRRNAVPDRMAPQAPSPNGKSAHLRA